MDRLNQLTRELLDANREAFDQYIENTKKEGYEVDFYGEVKPFTDRIRAMAEEWKNLSLPWVAANQPKYIHVNQINDTFDNLQFIAVFAFQPDTKEKRFTEMVKSIDYVLSTMLERLHS
ncbi:YppE family protein [Fictibacillus sp. KIGAM418]|uniref:YppE family protein n=1 Tax=Fictibacillus marinisediminis TaxID=2878389 RepID=A0A9X2BDB4_9BACL|nr:YppE family protein [Fictibacillus marinisediminis]MCK6257471.1 YppE family protein [Fictibacillus marinisediminis]